MSLIQDVAILTSLDPTVPVTAAEAAAALGAGAEDIFEAAASLIADGVIEESGTGWVAQEAPPGGGPRVAHLAGALAGVVNDAGRKGRLLVLAGREAEALPHLVEAGSSGDVASAEVALGLSATAPEDKGRLHLAMAAHHRAAGNSEQALEHARRSVPLLEGPDRVAALGYVAQVADDLGRPHEASTWATLAAGEAARQNDPARQGSLLTLAARSLSRIGFAAEAKAAAAAGTGLVETHGSLTQKARARLNKAWVLLDEGAVAEAAETFESVRDLAPHLGGDAEVATLLATHARALLRSGHSAKGLADLQEAIDQAGDSPAPLFLARLGLAEAATLHRLPDAVEAAEEAHRSATDHLPAWKSTTALGLARAHRIAGDREAAAAALEEAKSLAPTGIDGLRLNLRLRTEQLAQHTGKWPREEAAELTDALLQAQWLEPATELMILRAGHEKGTDIASQATALAVRLGNPVLAAEAAAASGWKLPEAAAAASLVKSVNTEVAEDWRAAWDALPGVAHALEFEAEATGDPDARLTAAFVRAGLEGDVLSPAQRRSSGVQYKARRTARGWLAPTFAALAVIVASTALFLALRPDPEPPPQLQVTVPTTPTTTIPMLVAPSPFPGGFHAYRANASGTGVNTESGISDSEGLYWDPIRPSGDARRGPVASGQSVLFASTTRDEVLKLDQATGQESWRWTSAGRVLTPLGIGSVGAEAGGTAAYVVWVTDNGTVEVAPVDGGSILWQTNQADFPGVSGGAPLVVEGVIYLGRSKSDGTGYVAALDLSSGRTIWSTEEAHPEMSRVMTTVSLFDGVLYAPAEDGSLWMLDAATGESLCPAPVTLTNGRPGRPVVESEMLVVPGDAGFLAVGAPLRCNLRDWSMVRIDVDPGTEIAGHDGVVYVVTQGGLMAIAPAEVLPADPNDIEQTYLDAALRWEHRIVNPTASIDRWVTSPVITGDLILMGSRQGEIAAIRLVEGVIEWSTVVSGIPVGGSVAGELAPTRSGVFALTEDGTIYHIGGPRLVGP